MTDENVTGLVPPTLSAQIDVPASEAPRRVLHEPFAWHNIPMTHTAWQSAEFAGRVRGVAAGTRDVLAILERDDIDAIFEDDDGAPCPRTVSPGVAGNLMRLCVTALALLDLDAERQLDDLDRKA